MPLAPSLLPRLCYQPLRRDCRKCCKDSPLRAIQTGARVDALHQRICYVLAHLLIEARVASYYLNRFEDLRYDSKITRGGQPSDSLHASPRVVPAQKTEDKCPPSLF